MSALLSDAFDSPNFLLKFVSRMDFTAQLQDRMARLVAAGRNHTMIVARCDSGQAGGEVVGFLEMGLLAPPSPAPAPAPPSFPSFPSFLASSSASPIPNPSPNTAPPAPPAKVPTIGNLVVKNSYRRKGIACELMQRAEVAARHWSRYDCIRVAVDPQNHAALRLYTAMGYEECGRGPQMVVRDLRQREMDFVFLLKCGVDDAGAGGSSEASRIT